MRMEKLKPCPFCGAKVTFGSSMDYNERIVHPDNGCYMRRCIMHLPSCRSPMMRRDMVDGWNTRYLDDDGSGRWFDAITNARSRISKRKDSHYEKIIYFSGDAILNNHNYHEDERCLEIVESEIAGAFRDSCREYAEYIDGAGKDE